MDFSNGDKVYIGTRYVGIWIGENPVTGSHVVYRELFNEYMAYHASQISTFDDAIKLIK